ncbi:hypothetical protein JCM17960_31620 [Magnetospira thiophila]
MILLAAVLWLGPAAAQEPGPGQGPDAEPILQLIRAIVEDDADGALLALRRGADPSLQDVHGLTPLDIAHFLKRPKIAELIAAAQKSQRGPLKEALVLKPDQPLPQDQPVLPSIDNYLDQIPAQILPADMPTAPALPRAEVVRSPSPPQQISEIPAPPKVDPTAAPPPSATPVQAAPVTPVAPAAPPAPPVPETIEDALSGQGLPVIEPVAPVAPVTPMPPTPSETPPAAAPVAAPGFFERMSNYVFGEDPAPVAPAPAPAPKMTAQPPAPARLLDGAILGLGPLYLGQQREVPASCIQRQQMLFCLETVDWDAAPAKLFEVTDLPAFNRLRKNAEGRPLSPSVGAIQWPRRGGAGRFCGRFPRTLPI